MADAISSNQDLFTCRVVDELKGHDTVSENKETRVRTGVLFVEYSTYVVAYGYWVYNWNDTASRLVLLSPGIERDRK